MLRKEGLHGHSVGGGPPKPLCRNFGQLPKLTGNWVDHPEPTYQGMYSQVPIPQMLLYPTTSAFRHVCPVNILKECFKLSRHWLTFL